MGSTKTEKESNTLKAHFTLDATHTLHDFVYHEITKIRTSQKALQSLLHQKLSVDKSFRSLFECVLYLSFQNFIVVCYLYSLLCLYMLKIFPFELQYNIEKHDELLRPSLLADPQRQQPLLLF